MCQEIEDYFQVNQDTFEVTLSLDVNEADIEWRVPQALPLPLSEFSVKENSFSDFQRAGIEF